MLGRQGEDESATIGSGLILGLCPLSVCPVLGTVFSSAQCEDSVSLAVFGIKE